MIEFPDKSFSRAFFPDHTSSKLQVLARQSQPLQHGRLTPSVLSGFLIIHAAIRSHKVSKGLLAPEWIRLIVFNFLKV